MAAYEIGQISALLSKNSKKKKKSIKGEKLERVFDQTGENPFVEFMKRDASSNKVCGRLIRKYEKETIESGSSLASPKTTLSKIENDSMHVFEVKCDNKKVLNDLEAAETVCDRNLKGHKSRHPLSDKVIATLKPHVAPSKSQRKIMKRKGDAVEAGGRKKTKFMPEIQSNYVVVDSTNNEIIQMNPLHKSKKNIYKNKVGEEAHQELADDPNYEVKKNKHSSKVLLNMEDGNSESNPVSHLLHVSSSYENNRNKKKNQIQVKYSQDLVDDTNSNFKRYKCNAKMWSNSQDVESKNSAVSQFSQVSPSWNSKKKKNENKIKEIPSKGLADETNCEIKKNRHKVKRWSNKEDVDSRSSAVSQILQVSPSHKSKKNKNKNQKKLISLSSQDLAVDTKCERKKNKCKTKMWSNTEDLDPRNSAVTENLQVSPSHKSGKNKNKNQMKLISSQHLTDDTKCEREKNIFKAKMWSNAEDVDSRNCAVSEVLHVSLSPNNKKNRNKNQMQGEPSQELADDTNCGVQKNKHNTETCLNVDSGSSSVQQILQGSPLLKNKNDIPHVNLSKKGKKIKISNVNEKTCPELVNNASGAIKKMKHKTEMSNKIVMNFERTVSEQLLNNVSHNGKIKKKRNKLRLKSYQTSCNDSNSEDVIKCPENIGKLKISPLLSKNSKQINENESDIVEEICGHISDDESSDDGNLYDKRGGDYVPLSKVRLRGFEGREDNDERRRRTVFVGNLPISFDSKKLKALLHPFGDIESARTRSLISAENTIPKKLAYIKKEYHQICYSLNGYVVFKRYQDALNALSLNGTVIKNHHIRVDLASNSKTHDCKRSVFVGNLPFDINDEKLWSGFAECGSITAVRLIKDNMTGVGKGFGFVLFQDKTSVDEALKLNGKKMFGRPIRVVEDENKNTNNSKYSKKSSIGIKLTRRRKEGKELDQNKLFEKKISKKKQFKKRKVLQMKKKIASILVNK